MKSPQNCAVLKDNLQIERSALCVLKWLHIMLAMRQRKCCNSVGVLASWTWYSSGINVAMTNVWEEVVQSILTQQFASNLLFKQKWQQKQKKGLTVTSAEGKTAIQNNTKHVEISAQHNRRNAFEYANGTQLKLFTSGHFHTLTAPVLFILMTPRH